MNDAIVTALGKPGSPMRAVFIGTLAPAMAGWWHELVKAGSYQMRAMSRPCGAIPTSGPSGARSNG